MLAYSYLFRKAKKILFLAVAALMATMSVMAQTSLTGRVYHQPNIMASMLAGKIDIDKQIAEARKKNIAEAEKKKGRKLTQEKTSAASTARTRNTP